MKDIELLPCPFCGAACHFEKDADAWEWVECESCGMQGNRSASLMEDCKPLLAEAWNRRAAVEADRAQRVPDVEALTDKIAECLHGTYHCNRVWEAWHVGTMSQYDFEPVDESETPREIAEEIVSMLASTPAPAQQEPDWKAMYEHEKRRSAMWIAKYEKDIGPLECAGPVSHQEQPQQERGPMTDVEIEGMYWEANGWLCADPEDYKKIVRDTERHHGIRKD